jgi:hypothetical protein
MSDDAETAHAKRESIEGRFVRGLMAQRDLNGRDMDRLLGAKDGTFRACRMRGFDSAHLRAGVERVLGVRIWSDVNTFDLRQACFRRYGFDPALLNIPELRQWVRKLEIAARLPPQPKREQLVEAILQHFAANPKR